MPTLDVKLLESPEARYATLERLVRDRVLAAAATKLKLVTPDARLARDLQQSVHEDMRAHFSKYPRLWGLTRTDSNIDHRRVPNLMTFLARAGAAVDGDEEPRPGDLVTMIVPPNLPHIAIVSDARSADGRRPLIVHNIGAGTREEDRLEEFVRSGHYRWPG